MSVPDQASWLSSGVSFMRERRLGILALLAMGAVYFFSYFQRVAVPGTVFNEIQSDLGISAVAVTGLGAIYLYIYAGAQLFVGMSADRYGGAKMLLLGGLVMCAGSVLFPLSRSLSALYASRALVGLGASFMFLCIVKELDALFGPKHFATMMGPVLCIGYLGGMAGTLPFERVAAAFGWRESLLGAGILSCVALGLAFLVLRRARHIVSQGRLFSPRVMLGMLLNRSARPLMFCGPVNFGIYFVIQSTLGKKFLQDFAGMSSQGAAAFTFVMAGIVMVVALFGGLLLRLVGDRRRPLLLTSMFLTLAGAVLLFLGVKLRAPAAVFLVSYILLSLSNGLGPAGVATIKELNRPDLVGQAVAVYNCLAYIGVAVLANVSGLVLDAFSDRATVTASGTLYPPEAYATLFMGLMALAVVSAAYALFIPETRGESLWAGEGRA